MRLFQTRPRLWCATSFALFLVIGVAVRWDTDGRGMMSLAGAMIDYSVALVSGRDRVFAEPFLFLAVWVAGAVALGWLLHRFLSMLSHEKSKPSA